MKLRILAVGNKAPSWIKDGYAEFAKRFPPDMKLELCEIAPSKHRGDPQKFKADEASRIEARIGKGDWLVALDEGGRTTTSVELGAKMDQWRIQPGNVAFLIGGSDGLAPELLQRANERLSLSALTLPHYLVRVVLAEALYRAFSISMNHPYHRA